MFFYYLKLAWNSLKSTPVNTLLMVLAVAIGVGVSMTTLTVHHVMSRDPIPEKSARLFEVQLRSYDNSQSSWGMDDGFPLQMAYQDAFNLKRSPVPVQQTPMYKTVFAVQSDNAEIAPSLLTARAAYRDFFSMFQVPFAFGSAWTEQADQQGLDVAVIGDELNQKMFAGANSIGKTLYLNQVAYRIVGVLKSWQPTPLYYDVNNGAFNDSEQIFVPFNNAVSHEYANAGNNSSWKNEKIFTYQDKLGSETHWMQYWVELDDAEQVQAYRNYLAGYVKEQKALGRFERDDAAGDIKNVNDWLSYNEVVSEDNSVLVGLSFLLLAVCLVNTIGLLLAKFLRRAPEIGVRRALGASQGQVFLQHVLEVSLLGLVGGLFGLVLAQLALAALRQYYRGYDLVAQMDMTMILTAPTIAIIACVLAGLYPAWIICRTAPALYLKSQ